MAYQPIEPNWRTAATYVPQLSPQHLSRPRIFDRSSTHFSSSGQFDELPLLDLPYTPKVPVHRIDTGSDGNDFYSANYGERSHFVNSNTYIRNGISSQRSFVDIWKDKLRAAYRYVRASGPAYSQTPSANLAEPRRSWLPTGWRLGVWFCCSAVLTVVILEISILAYAISISSGDKSQGSNVLLEGKCESVRELELWLLLPLNIAGTILIGTSNYVMQVVSAPDRKEIDASHAFAQPITVAGIRFKDLALKKTNRLRRVIWWTLGLSSIPIHFLLNAAVFSSVQASNTGVVVVSDDFTTDSGWDYCNESLALTKTDNTVCSLYEKHKTGGTQHMSMSECLRQYSNGFQTNASSVIVVTNQDVSPWYNVPLTANVSETVLSDLAVPCQQKYIPCDNSSYTYRCSLAKEYPDGFEEVSDHRYNFTYNSTYGYMTVNFTFLPLCRYYDVYDSDKNRTVIGQTINATDASYNWAFNSSEDLFLQEGDPLTNISSLKAVFSAFQYRYWSTSAISGDYLRKDYASLLDNRDPRFWLCPREDLQNSQQCVPSELQRKSEWLITPSSMPVKECHVLPKEEKCTLRYSLGILVITLFFDLVKLSAMFTAVKFVTSPLTTLGDIIQSFLDDPDPYTENCHPLDDDQATAWTHTTRQDIRRLNFKYCQKRFGQGFLGLENCPSCRKPLYVTRTQQGKDLSLLTNHRTCGVPAGSSEVPVLQEQSYEWMFKGGVWWTSFDLIAKDWEPTGPNAPVWRLPASTRSRRWFKVPSGNRWRYASFLFLPALMLAVMYFVVNFKSLVQQRLRSPWTVGFEAPDPNSLLMGGLAGTTSIYTAAALINLPQVAFSTLYFIFNATLTVMHTAQEWANFATYRKALRVSNPRGQQRATYWLQLPWTYSIPLIFCSGSMHWLLSRSLYIVKVDVYSYLGERESYNDYFACGYSPIPSLLLIVILASLGGFVYGLSFRKLPPGMPLVRLNSLAIASACHADPSEKDLALQPLLWGELTEYSKNGFPHYSFSAKPVMPVRDRDSLNDKKTKKFPTGWFSGRSNGRGSETQGLNLVRPPWSVNKPGTYID